MEKLTKEDILVRLLQNERAMKVLDTYDKEKYIQIQGNANCKDYHMTGWVSKDIILAGLLVERECLNAEYEELIRGEVIGNMSCGKEAHFVTVDENIMLLSKAAEMMKEKDNV